MNIGIIGSGNQAQKIVNILIKKKNYLIRYHYKKKKGFTTNLKKLFETDCIFILSPTYTHNNYLKLFNNYNGYIFLEKPGASNKKQSNFLKKKIKTKKLYINYNFIFSKIYDNLKKNIKSEKYGKLLNFHIIQSNAIALKKNYNNWRFDKKKSIGIEETNSVHFIHLILSLFKHVKLLSKFKQSISKKNIDNVNYTFLTNKNCYISFFNSYTCPLENSFKLIFVNCLLNYDGKKFTFSYPWNVKGKTGRLIKPPIKKKIHINFKDDWNMSNKKSVDFFLNYVRKKKYFSNSILKNSLKALYFIFLN